MGSPCWFTRQLALKMGYFWFMFGVKRTITSYCFTLLSKIQMTPLFLVLLLSYAL